MFKAPEPNDDDVAAATKALSMIRGHGVQIGRDHFLCLMFAAQRVEGNCNRYEVKFRHERKNSDG